MLVLSRKYKEEILIGDKITVTVIHMTNGRVRLGISAPAGVSVRRAELAVADRRLQSIREQDHA